MKKNIYKTCIFEKNPEIRKNHASVILEDFLVIFGGENLKGEILKDFWIFSFEFGKWIEIEISFNNLKFLENGIYHHNLRFFRNKILNQKILQKNFVGKKELYENKENLNFNISEDEIEKFEVDLEKMNFHNRFDKLVKKKGGDSFYHNIYVKKNFRSFEKKRYLKNKIFPVLPMEKKNIRKFSTQNSFEKSKSTARSFFLTKTNLKLISQNKKHQLKRDKIINKFKKPENEDIKKIQNKSNLIKTKFIKKISNNLLILFGGLNSKNQINNNNLRFLNYSKKRNKFFFSILKISQNSKKPEKRYSSTLTIYKKFLIIYGGINFEKKFLSDFWIFDFENLFWKNLIVEGPLKIPRAYHRAEILGDFFVVFGGISDFDFISNEIFLGDLNQCKLNY